MKVEVDCSGLEEAVEEMRKEIAEGMIEVARSGVEYAKKNGEYKNHTFNLRSSSGTAVIMDGQIVDLHVPAGSGHEEAKAKTENLLIYGDNPRNGIVVADGMEYASFVESKGFDVLSGAALYIESEANKKFN